MPQDYWDKQKKPWKGKAPGKDLKDKVEELRQMLEESDRKQGIVRRKWGVQVILPMLPPDAKGPVLLAEMDVDADDGVGSVGLTDEPDKAMVFPSPGKANQFMLQQSRVKPGNRPGMALQFKVVIL